MYVVGEIRKLTKPYKVFYNTQKAQRLNVLCVLLHILNSHFLILYQLMTQTVAKKTTACHEARENWHGRPHGAVSLFFPRIPEQQIPNSGKLKFYLQN